MSDKDDRDDGDEDFDSYEPLFSFVRTGSGAKLFIVHVLLDEPGDVGRILSGCARTFATAYGGGDLDEYRGALARNVNGFNAELINPTLDELRVLYGPDVPLPTDEESVDEIPMMLFRPDQEGEA